MVLKKLSSNGKLFFWAELQGNNQLARHYSRNIRQSFVDWTERRIQNALSSLDGFFKTTPLLTLKQSLGESQKAFLYGHFNLRTFMETIFGFITIPPVPVID